ncbi:MAG: ATP phosphoribosyltransferase regulatory subunit [Roseburia sp.]|nr:ATP phosphoribosyltransferase regulatory subunit [Roseburia sp.]
MDYEQNLLFTPEGVRDIYGLECEKRRKIEADIHKIMKLYGFQDIQTPTYEFFDIFNRERGTVQSKEMFKFFDQYNNTLVLRPDITPSIARCAAKYYSREELPLRLSYSGSTFIHRRGYQGKLSEISQIGAELMNDCSSDADAEMIALTVECLAKSGLKEFKIDVGHAGFIKGLMEETGFSTEEIAQYKKLLANKNIFGVEEMMESCDLSASLKELLVRLPDLFGGIETLEYAKENVHHAAALEALERLERVYEILEIYGLEESVTFDLSMLSHYGYYTGIIFKAYTYGTGEAIVTGGRYDNLIGQFGKKAPAIGLAIVLDQLMNALLGQDVPIPTEQNGVLILYRSADRRTAIQTGNRYREEGRTVLLMRKDADTGLEAYQDYAAEHGVSTVVSIEEGNVITIE